MSGVFLWWLALFGVWPLADPGHTLADGPIVWLDLALHFGAGWILLDREIERRARKRAASHSEGAAP